MNFRNLVKNSLFEIALLALVSAGGLHATTINLVNTSGTWNNVTGSPANLSGLNGSFLSWGFSSGTPNQIKSGYSFAGASAIGVQLNTPFVVGTFGFFNYPIKGNSITGATLNLNAILNVNGVKTVFSGSYAFQHHETPDTSLGCCNDLVSISNNRATLGTFKVDGQDYTIALLGFNPSLQGPFLTSFSVPEGVAGRTALYAEIIKPGSIGAPEPAAYLLLGAFLSVGALVATRGKKTLRRT